MALFDAVRNVCDVLKPCGWGDLMRAHGIDLGANNLAEELRKPVAVDRTISGFEDFAVEGVRGIEPGSPARSVLYHALASPNVLTNGRGGPLLRFPTLAEIEHIENYVFGVQAPSIDELKARTHGLALAICVFAYEYRPSVDTCHGLHADLVLSRTGVARVGTTSPHYDADVAALRCAKAVLFAL